MGQKVERLLPRSWASYLDSPALLVSKKGYVEVLPLVQGDDPNQRAGWCTSGWMLAESPDVEVMCGGVNTKRPSHAGIWRQGNLLHFGFEPSPSEMNDNGRALLANSIAYISRFTEDRPLTKTPSVFADDQYPRACASVEELINAFRPSDLAGYFSPDLGLKEMATQEFKLWFKTERPFLHANESGLIDVDQDAKKFGVSFSDPKFINTAISALGEGERKKRLAHTLLARYVEGPPIHDATQELWTAWYKENRGFLFFSEASGYKWHIDTLAKDRGVPTAELRGPLRATLPPPPMVPE